MNKKADSHTIWLVIVMILALLFLLFNTAIGARFVNMFQKSTSCESNFGHTCLAFCGAGLERTTFTCLEEGDTCCRDPEKVALYCTKDDDCEEHKDKAVCDVESNECVTDEVLEAREEERAKEEQESDDSGETGGAQPPAADVQTGPNRLKIYSENDLSNELRMADEQFTKAIVGNTYNFYLRASGKDAGNCVGTVFGWKEGQPKKRIKRTFYSQSACLGTGGQASFTFTPEEAQLTGYTRFEIEFNVFDKKYGTSATSNSIPQRVDAWADLLPVTWQKYFEIVPPSCEDFSKSTCTDKTYCVWCPTNEPTCLDVVAPYDDEQYTDTCRRDCASAVYDKNTKICEAPLEPIENRDAEVS